MRLPKYLFDMKINFYEFIRKNRFTHKLRSIDNYLTIANIWGGLPEKVEKVLVCSPHPDDESIGCGGTLAQLSAKGIDIEVIYMTSGASPENINIKTIREEEARNAAQILGINTIHFLNGQDGDLYLQPYFSSYIEEFLNKKKYDLIFCPWPYDGHSDHAATFRILRTALKRTKLFPQIWLFEVWQPLFANHVVNIDSTINIKLNAIAAHISQLDNVNYVEKMRCLASYRSLLCIPANYAEAFLVCDQSSFLFK